MLDAHTEIRKGDISINTISIPALTRRDLYRVLTCQASNSNLSVPVSAAVTIDMSFPPQEARILGTAESLSEGEKYELVCEASGSRPAASITWYKNGILMTDTMDQVFQEGNVSRSTLFLTPTLGDHDKYISCRAKNPLIPSAVQEDTRKLSVYYLPRLTLTAGQNLDMSDIEEGDDVYFECGIEANPKAYKVQWYHNGVELIQNVSAGIIQSNQSLVLQRVSRNSSGQYTCSATNIQGPATSNAAGLNVKYAPVCKSGQQWVYGVGKQEPVNVTCGVEAHPQHLTFRWAFSSSSRPPSYSPPHRWAFNSSSEIMDIPSKKSWPVGASSSVVTYTPQTHLDYGSLLCWATNEVGVQAQPCLFHVIPAATPEPVSNCSVANVSSTGAMVWCQAGWDGGLVQTFTLAVVRAKPSSNLIQDEHQRDSDSSSIPPRVLPNTSSSPKPEFLVMGLEAGTEYTFSISAVNAKGVSQPHRISITTTKDIAEKRTNPREGVVALTPILAVLLGVAASLLLTCIVIVAVVRSRRPAPKPEPKMVYDKATSVAMRAGDVNTDTQETPDNSTAGTTRQFEAEEVNPDVIPVNDVVGWQVPDPHRLHPYTDHQLKEINEAPMDFVPEPVPSEDHQLMKDYMKARDGSFYINPGNLMVQKSIPHSQSYLMGYPVASSTPSRPPSYAHHNYGLSHTLGRHASSGRATPMSSASFSSSSHRGSSSTVALNPDYCSSDLGGGDSPRLPLMGLGQELQNAQNQRESSV
ncbi:neural cell adhesion molecule 1-B-like isoform X2 [Oratosquilla oratoria]|uniref:neural cell adhesion molecule 1-B-like isoform X2 n=1 Tax=Oratosquilla oratoria TaxID=337810 RepID=UPI003F758FF9